MDWLWRDGKVGLRSLLKDRGLLVMAVLSLGLGIGSVTTIFSVIDNVLFEPFPYRDARHLMLIRIHDSTSNHPEDGRTFFSQPEFLDYQKQNAIFDDSIGATQDRVLWTGQGAPESFISTSVTGNTFTFFGVNPLLGRYATKQDANPSAPPVFVMSYKVWQKRFAADPSIVGKSFTLDGTPRTLVGIMPKRFAWMGSDIWIPVKLSAGETSPTASFFMLLGHLKPGLTMRSAEANATLVANRLSKVYPKQYPKKFDVHLLTLADMVVGNFRTTLFTLLAAVGLLLLIGCANVANLLLAKATTREKEFAVRGSLGAGRWRIIRQLMVESSLLGLSGALVGCVLAWGGLHALVAALPKFTFPDEADIALNLRVLAATILIGLITPVLFGLAPALGAFSSNLSDPLKAGGRGNSGFRRGRLRNALVMLEVALSLVLLTGAGLTMRSFLVEQQARMGFEIEHMMVSDLGLGKNYNTTEKQLRFAHDLVMRLENTPGVQAASADLDFPPFGGLNTDFEIAGKTHHDTWKGQLGLVDKSFFHTLGIRLLRGRFLNQDDIEGKRKVAVINEALAGKYFGHEDPIGKQIKLDRLEQLPEPVKNPWFEIVGVSSDVRNHGVKDDVVPEAYGPLSLAGVGEYLLYVRAIGNPQMLAKMIDGQVISLDRSVHPNETQTLQATLDEFEYAKPRFALQIFAVFAAVGLLLVSVGVYSVISYTVAQQTKEIGIRMALGANTVNVVRLVLTGGMRFVILGIGVGLLGAFFVLRLIKSQLVGVTSSDPLTFSAVAVLLIIVGAAACYGPATRATKVDPLISLHYE